MKTYKSILFLIFVCVVFAGCFWFSNYLYKKKTNLDIEVNFTHQPIFLNDSLVNKLLTQNFLHKSSLNKDSLDLNMLENQMSSTPELENVEIFIEPEGKLSFLITERKPLFKLASTPPFFSDSKGILFKYKAIDSLNIPVFKTSSSTLSLKSTAKLIRRLKADPFLGKELKTITLEENQYLLELKSYDFQIIFGKSKRIDEKIKKLKVFCAFQNAQDSLGRYEKINLSYKKQVVASTF